MAGERILIVEDDAVQRTLVRAQLEQRGYQARTANDGLEALRLIGAWPPHLVITDVNMPYVNGFELARRLRASHNTARIPVIMLSTRDEAEDILAGYAQGADDYVPKPVDPGVLGAKVEALLRRAWAPVATAAEAAPGAVVVFLRAKGGVGATTLAVNVAVSLAGTGAHRTALVDLNLLFGNAAVMLDLQPEQTLADLAGTSVADLDEGDFARFLPRHESGVRLLAAPEVPEQAELVSIATVQQALDRLRQQMDFILVDTPVSFTEVTLAALDAATLVCLVTAPQVASVKATMDGLLLLRKLQIPDERVVLVLNRTAATGLDNEQVEKFLKRKPDALVPYTVHFDEAANTGRPLVLAQPNSSGAAVVRDLASRIASVAGRAAERAAQVR